MAEKESEKMDKVTSLISGAVGGIITVAIIGLLINPRNKTAELIKESFSGFSRALGTAMGQNSTY